MKNLPANAGDVEMQVQSLDWEGLLEEGMAIRSSVLAWTIPKTQEPVRGYSAWGHRKSHTTEHAYTHTDYRISFPKS